MLLRGNPHIVLRSRDLFSFCEGHIVRIGGRHRGGGGASRRVGGSWGVVPGIVFCMGTGIPTGFAQVIGTGMGTGSHI